MSIGRFISDVLNQIIHIEIGLGEHEQTSSSAVPHSWSYGIQAGYE